MAQANAMQSTQLGSWFGTIKYWNDGRGFGFIARDDGQDDVFVHVSALPDGVDILRLGRRVRFEIGTDQRSGKPRAANVTLLP